jgi:hypothetical protein
VLAVTTDYSVSGQMSALDVLLPWTVDSNLASIHSDADVRYHGGLVYVLNHLYADNIQVLDPEQDFATVRQFSVGPGTNPQDIAFVSADRAYVSRFESPWLIEIDPTTGAVTDSIDLSGFADGDGIPEMSGMALHGGLLFVAVQRLDRDYYWVPVAPSYLVVIDTGTNEIVDPDPGNPGPPAIALTGLNPYRDIHRDEDASMLFVAESGGWGALDGGIEAVDPVALTANGFVTTEAQLGGDLYDFTLPIDGRAHAVIATSSPSWEQFCVSFDWLTGESTGEVWRPGGYDVMDIETHRGSAQLFVSDRTYTSPGVRAFDATDGTQLTTSPVSVGLPPHDLLVVGENVVGTPDGVSSGPAALMVRPNPLRTGSTLTISLEESLMPSGSAAPVTVTSAAVYDVTGRLVRRLGAADGGDPLSWSGLNAAGKRAGSGVYFVRALLADGRRALARVAVLR